MARRFARGMHITELSAAALAAVVLAAIFVPRDSGSGHAGAAGPPGQRDLNVAVVVQHPVDADRRLNLRAPPGADGGRNGHA
ncbi:MAG: hypothetical protein ACRDRJ_48950 [Streptosporangiaceae bacterium]